MSFQFGTKVNKLCIKVHVPLSLILNLMPTSYAASKISHIVMETRVEILVTESFHTAGVQN